MVFAIAMSGCALPIHDELDAVSGMAAYATSYDHVLDARANLLDRALADCPEKTVAAETACVRRGIAAAHPSVRTLIALVPSCRAGRLCRYDHDTRDRLGFVRASATDYVKRWRIDLDFRGPAADAAQVPVGVVDRDDFEIQAHKVPSAPPG